MPKIPQGIREFLKNHLAFVATADDKGMPNVVPKGDITVLGGDTIVFADLYSHQTRKNLSRNPAVAVCVINPASYTGYQLKGKARIVERGKEYEQLSRQAFGEGQLDHISAKYAVKLKVTKIIDIGYTSTADKEIRG